MCLDSELLPDCVKRGHLGQSTTKLTLKQLNLESFFFLFACTKYCVLVYSKRYIYKFNLFI